MEQAALASSNRLCEGLETLETLQTGTPIVPLAVDRIKLFAKLEYQNPFGSLKDRSAYWILKHAIARGEIDPSTSLVESSSGNFACAMALMARTLGLNFIPVIDPNINKAYESLLRSACAQVIKVDERDATGGFLATRLARVNELLSSLPRSFWTNQYENLDNMHAHYEKTGSEICDALDRLDYAFIGVSTGGTIAGLSHRLKEKYPGVKVIAVDAEGSVIFGGAPKKRSIPGLGSSIEPPLVKEALIDDVIRISEVDTVRGCRELWSRHGLFAGGSSGTAYAAIKKYFRETTHARPNVLFLCADRGTAYVDTVYNAKWAETLSS